ncbi:TadE/TadG family type IV pilus assembly protein [Kitasatospora sp. NPDC048296]|uniref:TadE/TadG family type IV pilus assembly protein n=1 Tax=Kitasatospora sp. NPDC048296 TaxID=3364048 RepID=UPI00371EE6BC
MPADTEPRQRRARRGDAGISTVELVLIAPVLMLLVLLLVGLGQIVNARGSLEGTARDAARAGSLQRDYRSALAAATSTANQDAARVCAGGQVQVSASGNFEPGGMFTITLSCRAKGVAVSKLPVVGDIRATSTSPLDVYRRVVQ